MNKTLPISTSWWLAAAILLTAALWMLSDGRGGSGTALGTGNSGHELLATPVVQARLSVAEPMISELVLTGHAVAERRVAIRAETAGTVAAVHAARGATVAAGEPVLSFAVDEREARLLEARSQLAAARTRYDATRSLKQKGYQAVLDLGQAKAALDAATAAVQMAELELARTEVRAPFAGVVDERYVEVGDFVDRGQPLALVVDLDPMRIVAQVSERYVGQIRAGIEGEVRTLDGTRQKGRVSYVGRVADSGTRTIPVELETPNPDGRLIEGITAELTLPVDQVYAHRVPPSVLSLADDGTLGVKSVDDSGTVGFHAVRVLGDSADSLWVGDLPAQLRLITAGQAFVRAGQQVEVEADPAGLTEPAAEPAP